MKSPRHIERDGYHVLDWRDEPGFFIDELWRKVPDLVVGRYLVNTSYDSGSLTLSDSELQDGWRMIGRLAHSPQIRSTDQIPHDQFDEWLVFDHPVQVEKFETMVNYCSFTPVAFDWDEKRDRFWEQVIRLRPLHVIAENDGVYLLSRDEGLIRRITNAEPDAGDELPPRLSGRSVARIRTRRSRSALRFRRQSLSFAFAESSVMSRTQELYDSYVEHPRYGRRPRITGLNPCNDYLLVFLHWHSGDDCRIPNTAIEADLNRQSPATVPVTHYFDVRRTCRDCAQPFIFFALEQRHWYEELGFGLDADCVRCTQCRKKQQGIAHIRQRYEELFHVADRGPEQELEMAECCLTLMEESLFHPRQAERVRMLLKRTADALRQEDRFLDLVERLREFERKNGEPASGGNR